MNVPSRLTVGLLAVVFLALGLGASKCRKDDPVPSIDCNHERTKCENICAPEKPKTFSCNDQTGLHTCSCNAIIF